MNRNSRTQIAQETLTLIEQGYYQAPSGRMVEFGERIKASKSGTAFHELSRLDVSTKPQRSARGEVTVTSESTIEAIVRVAREKPRHLAALNFASARNPGGGFLGGAQAQEETLARSSGLYACLLTQPEFYERHRKSRCLLYQDIAIFSPQVPFIRDDAGELLEEPVFASIITCPAPNAGALTTNEPAKLPLVPETLRRRAEFVLEVAARNGVIVLILGAWGCGVFRNNPEVVANAFASLLESGGRFANAFEQTIFAIYDHSAERPTYNAFAHRLDGLGRTP